MLGTLASPTVAPRVAIGREEACTGVSTALGVMASKVLGDDAGNAAAIAVPAGATDTADDVEVSVPVFASVLLGTLLLAGNAIAASSIPNGLAVRDCASRAFAAWRLLHTSYPM